MNRFNFQNQGSVITSLKEPKRKKRRINVDRMVFISLLLVGLFFLGRFMLRKITLVEADGQISLEKLDVNFTDDIRLQNIMVVEGDTVKEGDTLFSYKNRVYDDAGGSYHQFANSAENLGKEIRRLEQQIEFARVERNNTYQMYRLQKKELERIRKMVVLDVYQKEKYDRQSEKVEATLLDLRGVRNQIKVLEAQLSQLSEQLNYNNYLATTGEGQAFATTHYVAPMDGIIGRINFNPREVCYEQDNVMTIHRPDRVCIKAYFYQEAVKDLKRGDRVTIKFPDGTKSIGMIENFYVSTYELPAEFQKRYEPIERSILANVIPVEQDQVQQWKKFYKMNVEVSAERMENLASFFGW